MHPCSRCQDWPGAAISDECQASHQFLFRKALTMTGRTIKRDTLPLWGGRKRWGHCPPSISTPPNPKEGLKPEITHENMQGDPTITCAKPLCQKHGHQSTLAHLSKFPWISVFSEQLQFSPFPEITELPDCRTDTVFSVKSPRKWHNL